VKKPLTAALLTAAAVAILAVPAGAAVPKTNAQITVPCGDSPKAARVWYRVKGHIRQLAGDNPCDQYLVIFFGNRGNSDSTYWTLNVAPGAHFSHGPTFGNNVVARLEPQPLCGQAANYLVRPGTHGKFESTSC
jgi:hypothetical protein